MEAQTLKDPSQAGSTPVRGVIDMRAHAKSAPQTHDWMAGRVLAFSDSATSVASIALAGDGEAGPLRADEFVVLLSGELLIQAAGRDTVVGAGHSVVLPTGMSFRWSASAGTLAVIVACPATCGTVEVVVPVDASASLQPSSPPLAALLVGPTPSCRSHSDYCSENGEFTCGTWDSTPYHRRPMRYRHIELMHVLEGAVTLQDASGSATFSKGDVVLAARGAECAWISEVHVKKVYATHKPA